MRIGDLLRVGTKSRIVNFSKMPGDLAGLPTLGKPKEVLPRTAASIRASGDLIDMPPLGPPRVRQMQKGIPTAQVFEDTIFSNSRLRKASPNVPRINRPDLGVLRDIETMPFPNVTERSAISPADVYRGGALDKFAGAVYGVATNKLLLGGMAASAATVAVGGTTAIAGQNMVNNYNTQAKALNSAARGLKFGSRNRPQDSEYNPIMRFSRPAVRGGHLGASGNLTLSLNSMRTR